MTDEGKIAEGNRLKRNFSRQYDRLKWRLYKAEGDEKYKIVSALTQSMTDFYGKTKKLGLRTTGEDEPGKAGTVVLITPEWIQQQKDNETEEDRLRKQARTGDKKAIRELILFLARGGVKERIRK